MTEVHPVADLFPMLPDDELRELADDIAARGLDHPIVVDDQGRILDGRNRLAACELASVEPTFETYKGDDPDAYALANNIHRRHLTTGQRAMVTAKAVQVVRVSGGRGQTGGISDVAREHNIARPRIAEAQMILAHAPHLADGVMAGTVPFARAVDEARQRKRQNATEAERAARDAERLAEVRAEDAALADRVADAADVLTLSEAWALIEQRRRERDERRERFTRRLTDVARAVPSLLHPSVEVAMADWGGDLTATDIHAAADLLHEVGFWIEDRDEEDQ